MIPVCTSGETPSAIVDGARGAHLPEAVGVKHRSLTGGVLAAERVERRADVAGRVADLVEFALDRLHADHVLHANPGAYRICTLTSVRRSASPMIRDSICGLAV